MKDFEKLIRVVVVVCLLRAVADVLEEFSLVQRWMKSLVQFSVGYGLVKRVVYGLVQRVCGVGHCEFGCCSRPRMSACIKVYVYMYYTL